MGVFSEEFIGSGSLVWSLHRGFDLAIDPKSLNALPTPARTQIEKYAYLNPDDGLLYLCADDARFMNHSSTPNTHSGVVDGNEVTLASRDIQPGEELTCDYAEFDALTVQKIGKPKK